MTSLRFEISFINRDALREYQSLDGSLRKLVDKGFARLARRADEIGKPLAGKLAGCRELKFRSDGLRIIYRIVDGTIEIVEIIAIGRRDKDEVFSIGARRLL